MRHALVVAFAICLAQPVIAQAPAPVAAASCVDAIPASALRPNVVYLTSTYDDSLEASHVGMMQSIDLFTQAVAEQVRAILGDSTGLSRVDPQRLTWRDLDRDVIVRMTPAGVITWREGDASVDGAHDGHAGVELLLRVLDSVRAHGDAMLVSGDGVRDSVQFSVGFRLLAADSMDNQKPMPLRIGFRLFGVLAPVEREVATTPGANLRYPDARKREGYQANVIAEYVVGANGRADMDSFQAVLPHGEAPLTPNQRLVYRDFVFAVRVGLARMRFLPAEIGGCAVAKKVRQSFTFRLTH